MKFFHTFLKDVYIIEPEPFKDHRGMFSRVFCREEMSAVGCTKTIDQVNHSVTMREGSIRGMHYQIPPKAEIKIVKCIRGAVYDVVIDLREGSITFLKWFGQVLSEENMKMMYVPEGFAHGFQVLLPESELLYFHTAPYSPEYQRAVRYNDPLVNITWPQKVADVSENDQNHPLLVKDFQGICF